MLFRTPPRAPRDGRKNQCQTFVSRVSGVRRKRPRLLPRVARRRAAYTILNARRRDGRDGVWGRRFPTYATRANRNCGTSRTRIYTTLRRSGARFGPGRRAAAPPHPRRPTRRERRVHGRDPRRSAAERSVSVRFGPAKGSRDERRRRPRGLIGKSDGP